MARKTNEIFDEEWTALQNLWRRVKAAKPAGLAQEDIDRIDGLLAKPPPSSDRGAAWTLLNLGEKEVGAHLPAEMIGAEFGILLDLAKARKLPALATYEAEAQNLKTPPASEAERRRQISIYLALLHVLQSHFVETRFHRDLKKETATRLLGFGAGALVIAAVAPLLFVASYLAHMDDHGWSPGAGRYLFSTEPGFGLMMVAAFGILGAYFSRATAFYSKLENFSFEDVINVYQLPVLSLRLLYGMVGAIVFYYLLCGQLIAGDIFPKLAELGVDEQAIKVIGKDKKPNESGLWILAPTVDLAKLMVWSFLAGFSERLVPDALERTEAQITK